MLRLSLSYKDVEKEGRVFMPWEQHVRRSWGEKKVALFFLEQKRGDR